MPSALDKQLAWRCRRGMRELDLMLMPYFNRCYSTLDKTEQADFAKLLEATDQDLFNWLRGGGAPDEPRLARCVERIRAFAKANKT